VTIFNTTHTSTYTMKQLYLTLLLLSTISSGLFAQITASDTTGCAPLVGVAFIAPVGATTFNWDFDDGAFASISAPVHTFGNPGLYDVAFTGLVGGNQVTETITIEVYGKPTPGFMNTSITEGCVPLVVSFEDTSSSYPGSSIIDWEWAFGDGGVDLGSNNITSHNYVFAGIYDVSLRIVDSNGCDTLVSHSNEVITSNQPTTSIVTSPNSTTFCTVPFDVDYDGSGSVSNSPLGGGLTYVWNLGFGDTAYVSTPSTMTYTVADTVFQVSMTVTDDNSCSATHYLNVASYNPHAEFTIDNAVNDTICSLVELTDSLATGGTIYYTWGDGSSSSANTHTYNNSGSYVITQNVTAGPCVDSQSITVVVEAIVADFSSSPSSGCYTPLGVQFQDLSTNAVQWDWHFGDGTVDSVQNPYHFFNSMDTNQYTVQDTVYFNDTLFVTSPHGCVDMLVIVANDTMYPPTALFMPDVEGCCLGTGVFFSDSSQSIDPIASWFWDFDDGNTSTLQDPSHWFTGQGTYYVTLAITTVSGCVDTSFAIPITVGPACTGVCNGSNSGPVTVCAGETFSLDSLVTAGDSILHITGGPAFNTGCPGSGNLGEFTFCGGIHGVTVILGGVGWTNAIYLDSLINVLGPVAYVSAEHNCLNPFDYTFFADTSGADSWDWDFGDGDTIQNSTATTVNHTYAATGNYTVVLTSYNLTSGCPPFVDTLQIWVRAPVAVIALDSLACLYSEVLFDASNSIDDSSTCNRGYQWLFGDGTPPWLSGNDSSYYSYSTAGTFPITLIVHDVNGCCDSASSFITISDISAEIGSTPVVGCSPLLVNFMDSSWSDAPITDWMWVVTPGDTVYTDTTSHLYIDPMPTDVYLYITDSLGCTDSDTITVLPSLPDASFYPGNAQYLCAGDSVHFMGIDTLGTTLLWDFGDGGSSAANSPWHTYTAGGFYTVGLTLTDSIGCSDVETKNNLVRVQDYPDVGFYSSADSLVNTCFPIVVTFFDTSVVDIFANRDWDLGFGGQIVPDPSVGWLYDSAGTYDITLIVTTTFGCTDSLTQQLVVDGPSANFTLGPNSICQGGVITFDLIDTIDVSAWHWDFGDGVDTGSVAPVTHQYDFVPPGGQTFASLVFWGPDSTCASTVTLPVFIHEVIADCGVSDTTLCLGDLLYISGQHTNADNVFYDFGDGVTATEANPGSHLYTAPGTYVFTVIVSNDSLGCADTCSQLITVYRIEQVVVSDGAICSTDSFQLLAVGGVSYLWTPNTYLTNDTIANPIAFPTSTTTYTVTSTDINGCTSTASAEVTVIHQVPSVYWDTTIHIGDSIVIGEDYGPAYTYLWAPFEYLSCSDCARPTAYPPDDFDYTVLIGDINQCFTTESYYRIYVDPETTLDVPNAFSPGTGGPNSILYAKGWGIKKLLEFKIYNRWGQLVYQNPGDINEGWDGYFSGVLQNNETYIYQVVGETWIEGEIISKTGNVTIIR
jgi:gliding motility-associated-like protein